MLLILVPHAKCTPEYFFGCNDDEKLTIGSFRDGPYSVEDCYELCSKTTSCGGFDFGPAQHCILKEKGCSKDTRNTTDGFYFSMEKCKRCKILIVLANNTFNIISLHSTYLHFIQLLNSFISIRWLWCWPDKHLVQRGKSNRKLLGYSCFTLG